MAVLPYELDIIKRLVAEGKIPENTRRIVLDIPHDGAVTAYYETFADKEVVEILMQAGIEFKHVGAGIKADIEPPEPDREVAIGG